MPGYSSGLHWRGCIEGVLSGVMLIYVYMFFTVL